MHPKVQDKDNVKPTMEMNMFIIKREYCGRDRFFAKPTYITVWTVFYEHARRFKTIAETRKCLANIRKVHNIQDLVIVPVPDIEKKITEAINGQKRMKSSLKEPTKAGLKYMNN